MSTFVMISDSTDAELFLELCMGFNKCIGQFCSPGLSTSVYYALYA